jgi:uncharacterized membrane protein
MLAWIWVGHLVSVAWMTGLIWLIQIVHYPLMRDVATERFLSFHTAHRERITPIVMGPMLMELGTAGWLVYARPGWLQVWESWSFLGLTTVVFLSTALLSVPTHDRLSTGFDAVVLRRLVQTNWIRTVAWSLHLLLCLPVAHRVMET